MRVKQLDHINLTVANFETTAQWYAWVFGFEVVERGVREGRPWGVLRGGEAMLCIYEHPELKFEDSEQLAARGLHGIAHLGFRITDRESWLKTLQAEKLEHLYWKYPHSESWYVTDPTGWEIEVALWDNDRVSFG